MDVIIINCIIAAFTDDKTEQERLYAEVNESMDKYLAKERKYKMKNAGLLSLYLVLFGLLSQNADQISKYIHQVQSFLINET